MHKSQDYPGIGATHKFIAIGRSIYLEVSATRIICTSGVRLLPIHQRDCAFPGEVPLKYFPQYSDTNCYTECNIQKAKLECGCVPYFYALIGDVSSKGKPLQI